MTRPNPRAARFGPAWWDRRGHVGYLETRTNLTDTGLKITGPAVVSWGVDGEWPRPCRGCFDLLMVGEQRWVFVNNEEEQDERSARGLTAHR